MSLYKLDKLAGAADRARTSASARVQVFVEKAADGFADVVKQRGGRDAIKAPSLTVDVQNLDVQKGRALDQRRLRDPVGGRRVLDEAARESRSRPEEEAGGRPSRRG